MDTEIIEQRKNIMCSIDFKDVGMSTNLPLVIAFIPDTVRVTSITYKTDPTDLKTITSEVGVAFIKCNWTNDPDLFSFNDPCCYSPNNEFILKKPISGEYTFTCENVRDTNPDRVGELTFNLEFRKYKEEKQSKIY